MKPNYLKMLLVIGALSLLTACGSAPATNWPALATDGTNVFLSNGSQIFVVDAASGSEKQISTADGSVPARIPQKADANLSFYAPVEITPDNTIIAGNAATKSHTLLNIDPANGNVVWSFGEAKNTWIAKPLLVGNTLYAASGDGNLYIIDAKTGKSSASPVKISSHQLWASPVTDGEKVYVVNMDHQVVALNLDGSQAWSQELDTSILHAPLVQNGALYVGTLSGNLYALDAANGEIKWKSQLVGGIWGTPASDGTNIYIGTVNAHTGKFYSLSAENGATVWSKDEEGSIIAGPLAYDGVILYGTEAGKLQALSADGTAKWQALIENAHFYNTPLVVGNSVVMSPMNAEFIMVAYDLNGAQRWTFTGK